MWYVFADEEVIVLHSKGLNWLIDFQPGSSIVAAPLNRGSRGYSYMGSSSYISFWKLNTTTAQRFVSSIGNIEKATWVFNCLGRPGRFLAVLKKMG